MRITEVRTRVVQWEGKTAPLPPHFCTNPMDLVSYRQASMGNFAFHGWLLVEVSTDTGARVEGRHADQRVFGTFGPGPARDVLSQLLAGTRSTVVLGLLTGLIATTLSIVIGMSRMRAGSVSVSFNSYVVNGSSISADPANSHAPSGTTALVSFFFPRCPYCNVELPEIQKIYDKYKDRGLSAVWINILPEENGLVAGWQVAKGLTVPVLLGENQDTASSCFTSTPSDFSIRVHALIIIGGPQR